MALDTTIVFRWDANKEVFLKGVSKSYRLRISDLIRQVLDSFISRRGYVEPSKPSKS